MENQTEKPLGDVYYDVDFCGDLEFGEVKLL